MSTSANSGRSDSPFTLVLTFGDAGRYRTSDGEFAAIVNVSHGVPCEVICHNERIRNKAAIERVKVVMLFRHSSVVSKFAIVFLRIGKQFHLKM